MKIDLTATRGGRIPPGTPRKNENSVDDSIDGMSGMIREMREFLKTSGIAIDGLIEEISLQHGIPIPTKKTNLRLIKGGRYR